MMGRRIDGISSPFLSLIFLTPRSVGMSLHAGRRVLTDIKYERTVCDGRAIPAR